MTVLYSSDFLLHDPDPYDHPESPERLRRALQGLDPIRGHLRVREPGRGEISIYKLVHDDEYYERVVGLASGGGVEWLDPDTYVSPGTLQALARLAGAVEEAVETVRRGEGPVIVLGRPPGHHAGRRGVGLGAPTLGFCIFNTSALLAVVLSREGRVAVLDFDNHHGNGTQDILWREPIVHVDMHQDPSTIYPGTGFPWQKGESPGYPKANICLPPSSGDDIFLDAARLASSMLTEADPDYLVVSAGFDAYKGDSHFTSLRVTSNGFHSIGAMLAGYAERAVIVLEGGYTLGLERGLPAFVSGIIGLPDPIGDPPTTSRRSEWDWYERRKGELLSFI